MPTDSGYHNAGDGLTIYALDRSRTPKTIAKRLVERRAEIADILVGNGATDWAHYQRLVGEAYGLDYALQTCADVEKQQEH